MFSSQRATSRYAFVKLPGTGRGRSKFQEFCNMQQTLKLFVQSFTSAAAVQKPAWQFLRQVKVTKGEKDDSKTEICKQNLRVDFPWRDKEHVGRWRLHRYTWGWGSSGWDTNGCLQKISIVWQCKSKGEFLRCFDWGGKIDVPGWRKLIKTSGDVLRTRVDFNGGWLHLMQVFD